MKTKGRGKYVVEWKRDFGDAKKGDRQRYSEWCDVHAHVNRTQVAKLVSRDGGKTFID